MSSADASDQHFIISIRIGTVIELRFIGFTCNTTLSILSISFSLKYFLCLRGENFFANEIPFFEDVVRLNQVGVGLRDLLIE